MAAPQTDSRPGEFELIGRYFAPLAGPGSFGLADDAAWIGVSPGKVLVVTQDAICVGVHFFADDDPATIARKALRTNLSDLAAKGADPLAFSLALGLHTDWTQAWVAGFAEGLAADCRQYGLNLTGGDTFRAPGGPVISITAWGETERDRYRSRLGARPGDHLYVTGTIGDGALGLKVRSGEPEFLALPGSRELLERYLVPEPPVSFAPVIAAHASASMDISDGLVGDLAKMARASGVDFDLLADRVPLSEAARHSLRLVGAWEAILGGGDDYQLLFCVADERMTAFLADADRSGVRVTRIGAAREGDGSVRLLGPDGREMALEHGSYRHF